MVLLLSLLGCGELGPLVHIQAPIPPDWVEVQGWLVEWVSKDGEVKSLVSENPSWQIQTQRNHALVVLATPLSSSWQGHPAGCVYSSGERKEETILMNWKEGFAAALLVDVARAGIPLVGLNLRRIRETVEKRGGLNPWNLHRESILEDLLDGSLNYWSFRQRKKHSVHILMESGEWFGEYALIPPWLVGSEGWTVELAEGCSAFFHAESDAQMLVGVNAQGGVVIYKNMP